MEENAECPVCGYLISAVELDWHVNKHLDEDELARDEAIARNLASSRSPSQVNSYDVVVCSQGCGKNVLVTEWENHCLLHENSIGEPSTNLTVDEEDIVGSECSTSAARAKKCQWDARTIVATQKRGSFMPVEEGLMFLLRKCLVVEQQKFSAYALTSYIDHFQSTSSEDLGWGCGWRNIQMLCSHLIARDEGIRKVLFGGVGFVPAIASLQQWLELAWCKGFDSGGAEHFRWSIHGSQKWIGTTECAALLRSFGVCAKIVDFKAAGKTTSGGKFLQKRIVNRATLRKQNDLTKTKICATAHWKVECDACGMFPLHGIRYKSMKRRNYDLCSSCILNQTEPISNFEKIEKCSTSSGSTSDAEINHQRLVDWVWSYYTETGSSVNLEDRPSSVIVSGRPPLYFQHQGHSRTIVGIQRRRRQQDEREEAFLLVLDPSQRTEDLVKALRAGIGWQKLIKRGVHTLRKEEYQLCYTEPGVVEEKELEKLKTLTSVSAINSVHATSRSRQC